VGKLYKTALNKVVYPFLEVKKGLSPYSVIFKLYEKKGPAAFLLDCYKNLHYIQTSNKHGFFSKHLKVLRT